MARKRLVNRGHKIMVSLWLILLIGVYSGCCNIAASSTELDIIKVSTVVGGFATIPCNTDLPNSSEQLIRIVWYKNETPIYSYDYRDHLASGELSERASWAAPELSALQIYNAIPTDRGIYQCSVHFNVSPTKNQFCFLDVVELPSTPTIFDGQNKEVVEVAGPFFVNTSLRLTCVVEGGNPIPRLRWWRNDKEITRVHQINDASSISQLMLFIRKLSRRHYNNTYTCSAENTDLVPSLKRQVVIDLYLSPLSVKFLLTDVPFAVQQTHNTACHTVGARPPASITWWLGDERLYSSEETISDNLNETFSILRWTPQMENNGQLLKCRASHAVTNSTIEISLTLDLQYPPIVDLKMDFRSNPEELGGTEIYFECDVQAKPPPYKIVWKHNDQLITYNEKKGIITGIKAGSGYLVLRKALSNQTGIYTCTVSNVEGDTISNPLSLKPYENKPVCEFTGVLLLEASYNKEKKINCSTRAYPKPDLFEWSIKNSSGIYKIESDKFTVENGTSTLSYSMDKLGYGEISCKATNRVGQQEEPCYYSVLFINEAKPDILRHCTVKKVNNDFELKCVAGYNGGMKPTYVLELWESGVLLMNLSNQSPNWKFNYSNTEKNLTLLVYSYNGVGRSDQLYLRLETLLKSQLPTVPTSINKTWNQVAWVSGFWLTILAIEVMIIIIMAMKRYSQQALPSDENLHREGDVSTSRGLESVNINDMEMSTRF